MDNFSSPYMWIGAIAVFYLLYTLSVGFRNDLSKLPGPFFARFSGLYRLSLVRSGDAPRQYRNIHEQYGTIVRIGPNHVSVSDPTAIPVIYGIGSKFLKTPFYSTLSPRYKGKVLDSMFSTRDPAFHKKLKTPVSQLFSMTNMRNYEPHADDCTKLFMQAMDAKQDQPVDFSKWLQWYAFDVIGMITFRQRFGFIEQEKDVSDMIAGIDAGLQYVSIVGQYPAWHRFLGGNPALTRFIGWLTNAPKDWLTTIMDITEREIARYDQESHDAERTDFLAQLRVKDVKSGKIDARDMFNHLSNNLFAGSDTTGISLRSIFYYVVKNPRVYKNLVAEIDEADRHGALSPFVTYEQSLKLPYLQAVMKEAMRIHPGVGFPLERYVPKGGANILGVQLKEETIVSISASVVHADKEVYGEDADEFRPERWLEASLEQLKVMDRSFMAFGHGARSCIGKNISILEMGKFVPQMFRHYDIEWAAPDKEWQLDARWFWKQSGLVVKLKRRKAV